MPEVNTNPYLVSIRNFHVSRGGKDSGRIRDVVFGDFNVKITGASGKALSVFGFDRTDFGKWHNIYLDNVKGLPTTGYVVGAWMYTPSYQQGYGFGTWNCSFQNDLAVTTPNNAGPLAYSAHQWHFNVGGMIASGLANTAMSHLNYSATKDHYLQKWITYLGGANGAYAVNGNYEWPHGTSPAPAWDYARWQVFSECAFRGGGFAGLDFGGATQNVFFRACNIERCTFHHIGDPNGTGSCMAWYKGAIETTFRDNEAWGTQPFHVS